MIFPEDLKFATENFKKHCEDPKHPYDQVVRYRKKDGETAWVRCRGIAIRDKSGKPIRMLGAHNDITDLKKSILEVENLNKFMTGRELKMVELKQEVDALLKELGRKPKYDI